MADGQVDRLGLSHIPFWPQDLWQKYEKKQKILLDAEEKLQESLGSFKAFKNFINQLHFHSIFIILDANLC